MPHAQRSATESVGEFGILLKRLRVQAGLSQEQLAERARISVQAVGAYERGARHAPYRDTLALIIDALGVTGTAYDELVAAADQARRRGPSGTTVSPAAADVPSNNLPVARTTFVGRDRDVADVKEFLERHRLLTLVGSGGIGKTRLALQVGAELLDRYPDGVWFVDFAPISDPQLVGSVVAQALGMSQQQGSRLDEAIPQWLKNKQLLLIFDNCEHILDTIAALADAILGVAHDVRILATSRQGLNIGGEAVHRVPSLAVPADAIGLKMDATLGWGATALFVNRAAAADTKFLLTDNNAPIIADICRRLDGIPLAIELAAARVRVLSIPNLARRLNERFEILTGGSRTAVPRQKTLTALIDWSYDLLTPREQLLFARLGVFAAGFGSDAVTAVCVGDEVDDVQIFDLLTSLSEKSLLIADTSGDSARYRLLESTAAYALQKLSAAGERDRFTRSHAAYFREQAEAADQRRGSGLKPAWVASIEPDLDNYRKALEWALTQANDAVLGGAIAGALGPFWWEAGLVVEGRYWIELALPHVSEAQCPAVAARLQLVLGSRLSGKRSYELAERAAELYESVRDFRGAARAQRLCGFALYQMGRLDEAHKATVQALAASRTCNDMWTVADCLYQLANIEFSRGDCGAARAFFAQALAGMKALGDKVHASVVLGGMAELEFLAGNPEQALRLTNEALDLSPHRKNLPYTAGWHVNAAAYRIALGDLTGAYESARDGLRLSRQARDELYLAIALQHLALLAALSGRKRCAAQLMGYVDAQYARLGTKREPTEQWSRDKLVAALLNETEMKNLADEGATWSEDEAVEASFNI